MALRFRDFEIIPARRELLRKGELVDVQPLVYELLLYLVSNRDRVVPKDELLDVLWSGATVTEASLARAVSLARRAIDDTDRSDPVIRNHPRVGYRFTAEVVESADEARRSRPVRDAARPTRKDHAPAAVPMRSGYADAGGTHIAYQVVGDGPIDLVLVHGWILSMASLWEDADSTAFHQRLAEHARLILFDKRGTGLSDRVKDLPGLAQRMEDLTAVLDAVGSRRAHVLGVSEGAPMALLYAASHPERVAGLGLVGGFARMMRDDDQPFGWTEDDVARLQSYIRSRWGEGSTLAASFASRADDPAMQTWVARAEQIGGSPGAALELWNMNRRIDVRDVLPVLRTSCLVLHSAHDPVIDVAHGRQLAEQIDGARYVELDARDHVPFAPPTADRVIDEISAWLARPAADAGVRRRLATLLLCGSGPGGEAPDDAVDQLLLAHGGRRVDAGRPDCTALFDGPVAAARCARALVAALGRHGRQARLALHCGEIECSEAKAGASPDARSGRPALGVAGPVVEVAAQLLELAAPGEILTTATLTELSAGSGLDFEPRASRVPTVAGSGGAVFALR